MPELTPFFNFGIFHTFTSVPQENLMRVAAPAFVTLLNWLSGVFAILFATKGMLMEASLFIIAGAVFDFFDGLVARLLNAQSELGVQLDSLADSVTFGLAPGFIIYQSLSSMSIASNYLPLLGFIPSAAAVIRLAIFNTKGHKENDFFGLASPAFAIFIAGIVLSIETSTHHQLSAFLNTEVFFVSSAIILAIFMLLPLRMFSLKFKHLKWKENEYRYIFLIISLGIFPFLQIITLPLVIVLYALLSVTYHIKNKNIKSD